MKLLRAFAIASLIIAVLCALWALVNAFVFGTPVGDAFILSLVIWGTTGLPILIAGGFVWALRSRRTSLEMPAHLPDGKRR